MKDKIVALLITFFLGGLGIHQFYLGNTTKGILYLLFCWTFIPVVLAFIDFFIILLMSEETFNQKYNDKYHNQGYGVQSYHR